MIDALYSTWPLIVLAVGVYVAYRVLRGYQPPRPRPRRWTGFEP